jgi:Fe-S-cluster containining protein
MGASPHVCARCAERGTACCVNSEGVSGPPVTPGDIARIAAKSGLSEAEFLVSREVDPVEQEAWEADDPATRGLVRNGSVRSLARIGSRCVFLEARGCSLGEARPLLCQRFPLVRKGSRVEVKPGGACLAVEEARGLSELLVLLGTSKKRLRALDGQLKRELLYARGRSPS